jgi:hypothetical protein
VATKQKTPVKEEPKWTPHHETALAALTTLKVPTKEGRELLSPLQGVDDPGELLRLALRQRATANKRFTMPGAPQNAAPVNPPAPKQSGPSLKGFTPAMPPQRPSPSLMGQGGDIYRNLANQIHGVNLRGFTPKRPAPLAPIVSPTAVGPQEKPRVRIKAAGHRIPPAPIGGPAVAPAPTMPSGPQQVAQNVPRQAQVPTRPPVISSDAEFHKLEPGTVFHWAPDGHLYRKEPEPESSQP